MARLAQLYRNGILRPGWGCGQGSSASRLSRSRAAACRSRPGGASWQKSVHGCQPRAPSRSVRAALPSCSRSDDAQYGTGHRQSRTLCRTRGAAGGDRTPAPDAHGRRRAGRSASIHTPGRGSAALASRVQVRERPARRAARSCSRGGRCPGAARSARPGRALADRRTGRRGGIVFAFCDADAV
jgi:hypothetical protein